jgi:predicted nucleic acid-binding protein
MMVLVDTPIWSLALRRREAALNANERVLTARFAEFIQDGRARILGPIRQEVLSGIRDEFQFKRLREYLRAFEEPALEISDYEEAASMNNRCRARGISGSAVDFLICAAAHRRNWEIFTTDSDFSHYAGVLSIKVLA